MNLPGTLTITEVDIGGFFINELFRRKFSADAPSVGRHLIMFHRTAEGAIRAVCYAHFMPFGDIMLVGGVCTDGDVIRQMTDQEQAALRAAGGAYHLLLRHGFQHFAADCEAFFGYCGDARAEQVNLMSGFEKTQHEYLLVNFHKDVHPVMQRALIAKAAAIGPF